MTQFSFTQPICDDCWELRHPDREPTRLREAELETCCHCCEDTTSGIYVRVDPETVSCPTMVKT